MSDDNFEEFLHEFDPGFLRCVEVADQAGSALIRAAKRCDAEPLCVAYCMWANLTKVLYRAGWTDTELVRLIYHLTTNLEAADNEDS